MPALFSLRTFCRTLVGELPEGVVFEQVPSSLNPRWTEHARAYYSFKMMGVLDQVHRAFFDAIHFKRQRLTSLDTIAEFVAEQGSTKKVFRENWMLVSGRNPDSQKYPEWKNVTVTAAYRRSSSTESTWCRPWLAGSNERMLQIINYLVASGGFRAQINFPGADFAGLNRRPPGWRRAILRLLRYSS